MSVTSDPTDSLPLGRFIYERDWTPIRGAYMYPLKTFSLERSVDANDYLTVVRVVDVDGTDVAITRGGGLFVRAYDVPRTEETTARVVNTLNLLLCQFAIAGLVSQPVTDTDVQDGKLIGCHAAIVGGFGNFAERTWGPFPLLASRPRDMAAPYGLSRNDYWPVNFYWTTHDPAVLDELDGVAAAKKLLRVSPTLPFLVVAAAFHAARHNVAEAILAAWIVSEELLSDIWESYLKDLDDTARRHRLSDFRIYSASVQLEVLLTAGRLDRETYDLLHRARKVRNDLAHRSAMSQQAAATCLEAMRTMLGRLDVSTDRLPGYSFTTGGIASPRVALEPQFSFR